MRAFAHILFFLSVSIGLEAKTPPGGVRGMGMRFSFGPSYGFYSINTNHAQSPSGRMSALISLRKEIRCDRNCRSFFLTGVDYFFHGINFKSYYFDQDTLQMYDKSFSYQYSLFLQEIQVPLQVKFSFKRESNTLFSPYVMLGYHLRYLMPAKVKVTQDGNLRSDREADVVFRHKLFNEKLNSCISAMIGWQKNTINNSKTGFFMEAGYRYCFSQYWLNTWYTPSSLYMNGSHLLLQIGIKF